MQPASQEIVATIRCASRELVRELGFMRRSIAGTDLPPSAVHAIIEIGAGNLSAKDLCDRLLLEKSTVSRLVQSLKVRGEVEERRSPSDGRLKHIRLTERGERTLRAVTDFADRQVCSAISRLERNQQRSIASGLDAYSSALKGCRLGDATDRTGSPVSIKTGYRPGLIGRVAEMHANYYSNFAGFGAAFERKVATELSEFVTRLNNPINQIWSTEQEGRFLGSIAIDGEDLGDQRGHLRWFIIDDSLRGTGVGRSLMQQAIAFCDEHGFNETHLWTFEGLDAARHLYECHGFALAEEYLGDQWGTPVLEQRFVRRGGATPH